MNTLAFNIKHIREIKRYTQEYMASELGISQSNYQRIESGQIKISAERLSQIAKALEVTEEFLQTFKLDNILVQQTIETNQGQASGYIQNYTNANTVSNKLIEQYEARIQEQKERIIELKAIIEILKGQLL